jgi:hypothetical protein
LTRPGRAATTVIAVAIAAAVAMLALSGCDYATRKHQSEALIHAAKAAERAGTGTGTLAVGVRAIQTDTPGLTQLAGPVAAAAIPPVPIELAFGARAARAGNPTGVEAVFTGPVVYLKRPVTEADTESQFGFRPWTRLDFAKVGRKQKNVLTTVNAVNPINPTYLVRLLAGTLSGSVERLGAASVGGVATTHYRMNIDRDKAFGRLADKDRQAAEKAFASNNIKGQVFKGAEAWIDAHGLPRRFKLRVKQVVEVGAARNIGVLDVPFAITYTIDVASYGGRVQIAAPKASATAEVGSLNALLESVRT